MSIFQKDHGAISVFLIIILVPCMLVSSIFVDISRVHLSKAVAESSADLALNTIMANYDFDLSEIYGLMGSAQDIENYYSTVSGYYESALHSRELESDEIKLFYDTILTGYTDRFGGATFSDILQINNQTEGNVVKSVDGANMYNATILQEQVVEFMKYRGPIKIMEEIIERLKSDAGGLNEIKDSDKNKHLTDTKTEFYEAEGELLKAAFEVYWLTRDYTDPVGPAGENMSVDKLLHYASQMKDYRTAYKEIHGYVVGNLMNTSEITAEYSRVTMALDKYTYTKTSTGIYSYTSTPEPTPTPTPTPSTSPAPTAAPTTAPTATPEPTYYVNNDRVTALQNELSTATTNFDTALNDYVTACGTLLNTLPGTGDADAHPIQWWAQMNKKVNADPAPNPTSKVRDKADAMVKAYAKVLAMQDCTKDSSVTDATWNNNTTLLNAAKALQEKYLVAGVNVADTKNYLKAVNNLEQVSHAQLGNIDPNNLYVTVDGASRNIPDTLTHICDQLKDMQDDVDTYIKLLDKLLNGGVISPCPLDKLRAKAQKYDEKLDTWSNTADHTDTHMGDLHQTEIQEVIDQTDAGSESTAMCNEIDEAAVQELKTRLTNIRTQLQVIYNAVDLIKYGGKVIKDIPTVLSLKSRALTAVEPNSIGLTNSEVSSYTESSFSHLFDPLDGEIAELHNTADNTYNPLMNPDTGNVETPSLYIYFHEKFKDKPRNCVEEKEEEQKQAQEAADEMVENAKDKGYRGGGGNITPSSESSGDGFEFAASALGTLISMVSNILTGNLDNLRDSLYATTYIMTMFSYSTYDREGCYDLLDNKNIKLGAANSAYNGVKGAAETPGTWLSTDLKDSYNKTLTNKMINKDNNEAYLAEVEYILYGKSNSESIKDAYNSIYGIRYVLNLISAFITFWNGTPGTGATKTGLAIEAIASGISVATAGVIPIPLTKVIILPILTAVETCKDLKRLEWGFPVEVYKSEAKEWWCSLDSLGNAGRGAGSIGAFLTLPGDEVNQDKGLRYSDYLTLFVCLGLMSESDTSKKMYLRMADVIQANMRKATGSTEYDLKKTQVYFQVDTKLRVDPLMLALPIFSNDVSDPVLSDDWCTFEVHTIRGY